MGDTCGKSITDKHFFAWNKQSIYTFKKKVHNENYSQRITLFKIDLCSQIKLHRLK